MNTGKKLIAMMLSVLLAGIIAVPALAAETRTKIEKVTLDFVAYDDGEDGEYGEVEVKESGETILLKMWNFFPAIPRSAPVIPG